MTSDCGKIMLSAVLVVNVMLGSHVNGLFEFKTIPSPLEGVRLCAFRAITEDTFDLALKMGASSIDSIQNLENNLSGRGISVKNGSISHKQLIQTLPNRKAQETNMIAKKILKASQYIYNSVCIQKNIKADACAHFLSAVDLVPDDSNSFWNKCSEIVAARRDGNHAFRRLLPPNYKDGLYTMNDKLPSPREISNSALHGTVLSNTQGNYTEDVNSKNLALVQWAQFIEHDLSKPVASSLQDGKPIECCTEGNYKQAPRDLHPDCAPLIEANQSNKNGKETCLNYVRSALSIEKCSFGSAKQLNQATGFLDLSQLYGFTRKSQRSMRAFVDGKLKSSSEGLLPMADGESRNSFCAIKTETNEICFMAGDTRVNSNPYSIVLYTILLRSHNRFADEIKAKNPNSNDEAIFREAKRLNVEVYRAIVFEEWLPVALGQRIAGNINSEPLVRRNTTGDYEVSNEFAVAAIRFYLSMMPNILQRFPALLNNEVTPDDESEIPSVALFNLLEEMFRSESLDRASKVDQFLSSMLNQKALRMDTTYAGSLIEEFASTRVPSRQNILAFDIQRGRDHGLQVYVKYLEQCEGRPITSWEHLSRYIAPEELLKLKSVYEQVTDIDLIVGGIAEIPASGSTVGPTFTCILGEQFSKIRQWHHNLHADSANFDSKLKNVTAAKLLCSTTGLREVPKNIFLIPSNSNPLVSCSDLLKSTN